MQISQEMCKGRHFGREISPGGGWYSKNFKNPKINYSSLHKIRKNMKIYFQSHRLQNVFKLKQYW